MNLSPVAEFRPHVGRLLLFILLGAVAGALGFGLMLYFGVVLLAVGLIGILLSRSAKVRVAWWGMLCGVSLGFAAAWAYLRATHQLQF